MNRSPQLPYLWVPGEGYEEAALGRMKGAFQRPAKPMGEAWFMSAERRMFQDLCGDLDDIPIDRLQDALGEIASGTHAFGPYEEWRDWFHYLLPRLIPRSHESWVSELMEVLITAFITQYPTDMEKEAYRGFRLDVLNTLGRCMMHTVCWPGGVLDPLKCLKKFYIKHRGVWLWDHASSPLSASMFFCLKYLEASKVKPWLESVLSINNHYWRAQIMIWLLGAHKILSGTVKQPSALSSADYPKIDWEWSHCLSGNYSGIHDGTAEEIEFIDFKNRLSALETAKSYFTEAVFLEWLESFATDKSLEAELADTPYSFFELYKTTPIAG